MKWSSVNEWKAVVIKKTKENLKVGNDEQVKELVDKKRGRPIMISGEVAKKLREYIIALHDNRGVVNTAVVIAAGTGMLLERDPTSLACNIGHVILKKSWAKYFLGKIQFVK